MPAVIVCCADMHDDKKLCKTKKSKNSSHLFALAFLDYKEHSIS